MHEAILSYIFCPTCRKDTFQLKKIREENGEIIEGVLTCLGCGAWYKVDGGILDLLPRHLRRTELYTQFSQLHGLSVDAAGQNHTDKQKLEQIAFFKKDFESYEETVVNSPYFRALTTLTFRRWLDTSSITPPILEIACGTGQQTVIMVQKRIQVIAIDLSEEMIRMARQKTNRAGLCEYVDYIVADAENPPLKERMFGACVCCGALHHINNPGKVIQESARRLRKGGLFYTIDPHDSRIRFLFDLLMRMWKLYDEQASDNPLINRKDLAAWLNKAGIENTIKYSTYIPPHLFFALSDKAAICLLKNSDALFNSIPQFSILAGNIISEGVQTIPAEET